MRIKTVTFHGAHNYGAVLQAYALQKTLISLGCENEIIDYRVEKSNIFIKPKLKKLNKSSFVAIILNILILIRYYEHKTRFNKFEKFINENLILTKSYNSFEELKSDPPDADVYLAGSDQVWNISSVIRDVFFLKFGNSGTKRVSYAASMGTCDLSIDKNIVFGKLINNFDRISVREKEVSDFIMDNYKIKSDVHLDPVFLLDKEKWGKMAIDCGITGKYILCYRLSFSSLLNDSLKKLKQMTGYKVVVITTNIREKVYGDIYIRNAGPREFLGLIKNAQIVLTTSFHGTVFSIIFEKRFYSFPVVNKSRITNILNLLELNDRQASDIDDINLEGINYDKVNVILNKEINKSIDYLKRAIEK